MVFKNLMFRVQNAWNLSIKKNCIGIKWLQMSEEVFFYVEKVKIFYDVRKKKNLCIKYKYLIFH